MLADALAASRLSKTLLASRAGLGRTTVHEALRASAPAPSAETVVAMARALGMAREERSELLGLRRTAAGPLPAAEEEPAAGRGPSGPPRPIWSRRLPTMSKRGRPPSRPWRQSPCLSAGCRRTACGGATIWWPN
ncbi:helix-turn-helix domain-containing protein [Streptomyces anulatus]|uniref:helix-turn-helix domain-containing protein n=1 Tax=Streptomyces anulatus TaxID=1892 RepID=UPI00386E54A3